MKQELPFAVALLATGCLLCLSQFTRPENSSGDVSSVSGQPATSTRSGPVEAQAAIKQPTGTTDNNTFDAPARGQSVEVMPASYQENVQKDARKPQQKNDGTNPGQPTKPNSGPGVSSESAHDSRSNLGQFVHPTSSPMAIRFLAELSEQVSNSQPIGCSIELTGSLYGQVVSASGNYYQMGQGSHKSRTELRFGVHPNSPSVIQLCDGRFVYKFQSFASKQSMEFVDLQRVRATAGEKGRGITPTGWVASGGIASLFQHLASAFNFGELIPAGDSSVILRGSWDEHAMQQIAGVEIITGQSAATRSERWSKIPAQLPHAVELVFRQDENLNYFPKRIKFLKFSGEENADKLSPMVVLEFSAPQRLSIATDRYFLVDSTDLDLVDTTDEYIARIEDFDHAQQTAAAIDTLGR